jgi:hypothetical protein
MGRPDDPQEGGESHAVVDLEAKRKARDADKREAARQQLLKELREFGV